MKQDDPAMHGPVVKLATAAEGATAIVAMDLVARMTRGTTVAVSREVTDRVMADHVRPARVMADHAMAAHAMVDHAMVDHAMADHAMVDHVMADHAMVDHVMVAAMGDRMMAGPAMADHTQAGPTSGCLVRGDSAVRLRESPAFSSAW